MRRSLIAASAVLVLGPLSASIWASVPVEQIEAYEGTVAYAPINFNGSPTLAGTGPFTGISFHAVDTSQETLTLSTHAFNVAGLIYAGGTIASPYVTDVYADSADSFLKNIVDTQSVTGSGPAPGNFSTGVQVVNCSYVADYDATSTDLDAIRRMDFMVNRNDVTFIVGAVGGNISSGTLNWSCYNSLAVSGVQAFTPTGGPGKQHADLYYYDDASYSTAIVSDYAVGLYGNAESASQTDAEHSYMMRSLLMAGADKGSIAHQANGSATGALDPYYGAGIPDYDRSLQILQSGEKTFATDTANTAIGTLYTTQEGWASASISAAHQSVILFNSSNAITGLTASLNWNVTTSGNATTINTSNSSSIFPNLTLEVRPVTIIAGISEIGASLGNYTLLSSTSNDNVQYLWANTGLPAGDYAFVITGDASKSATVGFSYTLAGSFASRWNSSSGGSWGTLSNWTNGIPNGQAAQANLLSSPGLSTAGIITLDSDRTVGQLTFNNPNGYTIAVGSGGSLIIDDTGDSSGTLTPFISVLAGSQTISAPVELANGVTATIATGAALNISGAVSVTASGTTSGLIKSGGGTLTLNHADSYGTTTINAGNLIFAASSVGIVTNTQSITINAGGTATLAASPLTANRQLLIASTLSIAGSSNSWTGKLDLNDNDMDVPGGSLATITNQLLQGYNNGAWNGSNGIVSSSAALNTTRLTTLGVIQNNQNGSALFTSATPFDGDTSVGASDILVKYTYYGDANLDGKVDGSDYSLIDSGFVTHATGWFNGDFNYDGVINGSDYTLIDNAFNTQGAQISAVIADPAAVSTAEIASVPEPGMFAVMSASLLLLRRRRTPTRV